MFHEGQFEGRKVRLPVFLGRRPAEPVEPELLDFYRKLLAGINRLVFREGEWHLCERTGWPDNQSWRSIVAWRWNMGEERCVIAVNLSDSPAQARVQVGWNDLRGQSWSLTDQLSGINFERSGDEMAAAGLYLDLPPWGYHFLDCRNSTTS